MTYSHLFWDFDGTLYNSYSQMTAALQRMMEESGLPAPSPAEALPLFKCSVFFTVSHYAQKYGKPVETLLERFRYHHSQETAFPPYRGLAACLNALHRAGCRHYLYTHRDSLAIQLLKRDGVWPLFADAITSEDGFPHKPAPDALLALLARHVLEPSRCLMIGDRSIDILSAQNAGIAGAVFDPDSLYTGPEPVLYATSLEQLTNMLMMQ